MDLLQAVRDTGNQGTQSAQSAASVKYAGIDTAYYPGDAVMQALIENTNLFWTGFYLTPAPSQGHNLGWMSKYQVLRDQGWGIAPVYVGQQEKGIPHAAHHLDEAHGTKDGTQATSLAGLAKIPPGSVIYLDFENGPPCSEKAKKYFIAWSNAVQMGGYTPGVYCLHGIANDLIQAYPNAWVWAVNYHYHKKVYDVPYPNPDPVGSGYMGASLWQLAGNCFIHYKDLKGHTKKAWVDLNSSDIPDPSQPA